MAMTELAAATRREPDPCGLSGWLLLVIASIVAGLAWNLFVLKETTALFTGTEAAVFLASAEPALYQLTMLEIFVSGCLILANLVLIGIFFTRHRQFPAAFIMVALFSVAWVITDALLYRSIVPADPLFDAQSAREFARAALCALVWVPYMLVSKRVKATFVF